jgi:hypothetical protein
MKIDYRRSLRKWIALLIAAVSYFVIHEGAHWIYAMYAGAFRQINFLGIGIQIDIYRELMSDMQFGIFNLAAPVATIITGYILLAFTSKFLLIKSDYLRAVAYYLTIVFLILDPLYLSVIYPFVGGGDMNGIVMLMPELTARLIFGMLAIVNTVIVIKIIVPKYRQTYIKPHA